MSWKRFFFGDKMPSRDDPAYKERYEREVAAGRAFADKTGISWCAARLQYYGSRHPRTFLSVTFGIVIFCFLWNMGLMYRTWERQQRVERRAVAVHKVDSVLHHRRIIHSSKP